MARKVVDVTITAKGRDQGKVFVLTEMPSSQAEKWATRALLAIGKSGINIPEDIAAAGMAGIANIGIQMIMNLSFADAGPLMDEMMACVTIRPSPLEQPMIVRKLVEDDIEEVATRLQLRAELFALHTGFFIPGFPSTVVEAKPLFSSDTATSPDQ